MKPMIAAAAMGFVATTCLAQTVMDGKLEHDPDAMAIIETALLLTTPDPLSAQLMKMRRLPDDTVCGLVNLKNEYGGYSGFQPFAIINGKFMLQDTSQCRN